MSEGEIDAEERFLDGLCRRVLRPLVGLLMRNGVPFKRFSELAREQYVDVASREFGIDGRRTNVSRIAMLTGLSRVQVRNQLDRLQAGDEAGDRRGVSQVRHVSRMLLGWHTDARFSDESGRPRPLKLDDAEGGFEALYNAYSGKVVPQTSLLKELLKVGAIEKTGPDEVVAKMRTYQPAQTDQAAVARVAQAIADLTNTATYNLYRKEGEDSRFERFATNQLIHPEDHAAFRAFLEAEAQAFLERADDWLTRREDRDGEHIRIGVGVYQIHSPPENDGTE